MACIVLSLPFDSYRCEPVCHVSSTQLRVTVRPEPVEGRERSKFFVPGASLLILRRTCTSARRALPPQDRHRHHRLFHADNPAAVLAQAYAGIGDLPGAGFTA